MRRLGLVFGLVMMLTVNGWWLVKTARAEPTATVYFVSENGINTTGGIFGNCQFINPCATLGFVLGLASNGDTINLFSGTYIESITIDKEVTISGPLNCVPVCATWQAPSRERNAVIQTITPVTVSHLALIGGNVGGENGGVFHANSGNLRIESSTVAQGRATNGGAIYQMSGSLVLTNTDVFLNMASSDGGAVFAQRTRVEAHNSQFRLNSGVDGGAMLLNNSGALLVNTLFASNGASGWGGAVYSTYFDPVDAPNDLVVMKNVTTDNNSAESGGAVAAAYMEAIDSTFTRNSAENSCGAIRATSSLLLNNGLVTMNGAGADGGGVCLVGNGETFDMQIDNTVVSHNEANGDGGGLFISSVVPGSGQLAEIGRTHIYSNTAASGGGVKIATGSPTINFVNSEITHNHAMTNTGGGMQIDGSTTTTLFNVTLAANRGVATGSGLNASGGDVRLANTILADNGPDGAASPAHFDCAGAVFSLGYNFIGVSTCGLGGDTINDQIGSPTSPLEAGLVESAETGIYQPTPISPLVDAGDPSGCRNASFAIIASDYFGNPRSATRCDVGAVELQTAPTAVAVTEQMTANSKQLRDSGVILLLVTMAVWVSSRQSRIAGSLSDRSVR